VVNKIPGDRKSRPRVLLGLPFKDKWFVSPGNSYISKLIEDAGGRYLWAEIRSDEAIPMSLEAVCLKAREADIWLNPGTAQSINNIHMLDNRLVDLPVSSEGSVFNNNKRVNKQGGNDYWESGTVNPHILLKDIASILNPGLFPGYEPFYYSELKKEGAD
jgi:iron complex transport system substrate-binding protein